MQTRQGKGTLSAPTDHPGIGFSRQASRVSSNVSMQLIHRRVYISIIKGTSHSWGGGVGVVGRSAFSEQELKAIIFQTWNKRGLSAVVVQQSGQQMSLPSERFQRWDSSTLIPADPPGCKNSKDWPPVCFHNVQLLQSGFTDYYSAHGKVDSQIYRGEKKTT